ncbi:hypothetical protein RGI145_21535 [Roseomonas gilardii]|uniref:Autotransporter domain-containing protein n=1 Tax=Roseomonas gilardii TaxID=257708 RepID=A0A1L7AM98_9PROT|nr:hypothetical protein [Roseomonas gilardii]APT59886.1 hypothetical protein RGI145_21535 [Roseomonas gilardii]
MRPTVQISIREHAGFLAVASLCILPLSGPRAQTDGDTIASRLAELRSGLRSRPGGVLGLMGYNATPDGSANAVTVDRSRVTGGIGDRTLTLGQLGSGFTVSESFPLFLEGYLGYARYDPRAVFSGGEEQRLTPLRWNNVVGTVGVGYDIRLGEYLWLRPILNASLGYAASDASLFGDFVKYKTGVDISVFRDIHMNVWGLGGSMVLAYYDYRPKRDIDVELRYTQIRLETFGDTLPQARGSSTAQAVGLWTRLRWPTGLEAFGRPVRWVIDGSASTYLGDQRDALGFSWSAKIGGGIEFDVGRYEMGGMGLYLSRVRFLGRYFFADRNITGVSFGIGMSF